MAMPCEYCGDTHRLRVSYCKNCDTPLRKPTSLARKKMWWMFWLKGEQAIKSSRSDPVAFTCPDCQEEVRITSDTTYDYYVIICESCGHAKGGYYYCPSCKIANSVKIEGRFIRRPPCFECGTLPIKKSKIDPISKAKNQVLSTQEIKYLIEKAESCVSSNELQQALKYYNQLIENAPQHPHYFKRRAWINRMIGEFDAAISDMNKAIKLDSDDANSYWERGACYAHKLSQLKNIDKNGKKSLLEQIIKDYKGSVERNPTSPEAWLAILETDMLLHNWDDAISNYGACKPYIDTKEYQLVRSWLGCLSLIFADDPIEEEDRKSLYDKTIRLKKSHWCVSEIDSLFIELEMEGFNNEKLKRAEEIHKIFLEHFDEQPIRFHLQKC